MIETVINYSVLMAFLATSIDVIIQIFHIYKRKSSRDLSLKGCFIRLIAIIILTVKFFTTGDVYLIVGQSLLLIVYIIYFMMLIYYRR